MATSYLIRAVTLKSKCIINTFAKEKCVSLFKPSVSCLLISRSYTSFVKSVSADQLWLGVTSVSNAGRKRGRARNVKRKVDLNRGQRIGVGKSGMVFPGLTGPAIMGKQILKVHTPEKQEAVETQTAPILKHKRLKVPALQRGYSGRKFPGTSIGPPDPINDYEFTGFDTKVIEYKMVAHMTGNHGRKSRISALVVTGNGAGLAGFALAKAPTGKGALRKAKNMAAQRLQYFERFNNHTVFHDFAVTEGKTTIFVQKRPEGYGLICHRVIKTMCEVIGIKDLYAKTEGRTGNIQNLTKAFFRGLMEQETHQQLADRMRLNVVEYRPELENLPIPVARPSDGQTRPDPIKDDSFEFDNLYYKDGRIPLKKFVDPLAKLKLPSTVRYLALKHKERNQEHSRYMRMVTGVEPSPEEIRQRLKPLK
ncbi:small ribosomal subunit protein uS5m-like [Physella acuta]|uniref:small ribosomal subunit protein uS5m-like n=1 Tax=Physella acuta TaxID=109671 RepID=UPI0027DDF4B9|nr:small ribosomal subunit protein uS5m-like [Physella acuta]